jgi:hypothetical protein
MADKPILFSAPMVLALLDGRKTQERRVLKPQPQPGQSAAQYSTARVDWQIRGKFGTVLSNEQHKYRPGVRLWVREGFTIVPVTAYRMSDGVQQAVDPSDGGKAAIYAAGWERSKPRWKPSIHMPRWASRITLIVESVKVERLQDISEADAKAEGAEEDYPGRPYWSGFGKLWTSINGPGAWAENPWVAAISFSVIKQNIDHMGAAHV